jgi:hypothetical protein
MVIYLPNLTSVKDNLKIYNKLMFFKTLPKRTRKVIFKRLNRFGQRRMWFRVGECERICP